MKLWSFLFVFCLFAASCGRGNKMEIPKDVMSRDTMVDVLTDVHLIKAAQQMGMILDPSDTSKTASFEYVWKKHHITEAEYQKSLDFYTHNPAILDSIYENVLNNLSKQKAELLAKRRLK
jgi:Domain of unknown function (DUF4296)